MVCWESPRLLSRGGYVFGGQLWCFGGISTFLGVYHGVFWGGNLVFVGGISLPSRWMVVDISTS